MNWWQRHDLDRAVVPVWAATLALAVCVPLFARGYVLTYDMVWVPQLDLDRPEIWGLGTGLPRAVPSDAVVALLDTVLPAALVQRLVLFAALSLLALGTARLLRERPLVAQLSGATLAVWNPFIAERLVLGQWPLLLALAAFPWLIGALGGKDGPRWAVAVIALAATALTPATGVMGVLIAVTAAWRRGVVTVVLLAALVNGPWIVAGLLRASISRTDPAAVKLFELQPEGHFGRLGSALTLGGVWNTEVVPTSRTLWIAVLIAVVIGAVIVVGLVMMWRDDRRLLAVLGMSGAIGLAIALLGWLAPELVTKVVADVPAGGLIRDGTRWLAMLVPLEAVAFGAGVHAVFHRFEFTAWELPVVVLAVMLPLTAIPDLAWGVGGRLDPSTYPASWSDARRVIEKARTPGDILVLPFSAYRRPSWNDDTPVLDPAGRYFDRATVVNDELVVSGRTIAGEDPRARRVGRVLQGEAVTRGVARQGIGLVVVETDALGARESLRQLRGARELAVSGNDLRVFAIPGARPEPVDEGDRRLMIGTWGVAALTLLVALIGAVRAGASRWRRRHAETPPRVRP
ncbi:hypothetical protein [Aeromicrobium sp.]|uniref:hypothetical protein n=1 Tax=Aeromicrobium sp. TaxID=1871063 RepID=UPI0030BC7DE1